MFQLITTYQASGNDKMAHESIKRAQLYYQNAVETERMDIPQERLCWAKALVLDEEYAKAIEVLETGYKRTKNQDYRTGIADLCAAWARSLAKGNSQLPLRIKILHKGLQNDPANSDLLELLLQVSHMEGSEAISAREDVTKMLVAGGQTATLHVIAGNDAWLQGHTEEARTHWSIAYDQAPNMPVLANNLAMTLSLGDKPDLPRALGIINTALENDPQNPNFRDTRGQILVKLGRWKEAVEDLEFAIQKLSVKSAAHAALATAYGKLGMQDLADAHQHAVEAESAKEKSTSQ